MLKPLAQAQANGDRIHGVIRATALNSGGRSSGFTVPSASAQEKVIRQALSKAGVDASQIDYVEAHGTGTRLGDPIEINALSAAYGTRQGERRCIGSIKSNIGHLESAAGLAGLVKILLQFQHQSRVPTLNCEIENPWLNLGDTDFRLPRTTESWTADTPLLAGLSSFGAGGSNAHVIVQQYIDAPLAPAPQAEYLLPVSARTPLALKAGSTICSPGSTNIRRPALQRLPIPWASHVNTLGTVPVSLATAWLASSSNCWMPRRGGVSWINRGLPCRPFKRLTWRGKH